MTFPSLPAVLTNCGVLAYLAKVYDPLGLVSPVLLEGKLIYRDICEAKCRWDAPIQATLLHRWKKWEKTLPCLISFTRSIPAHQEIIQEVKLHSFGDASMKSVCAAVYAVVKQDSGTVQRLVAAKSRLAKTNLTIPRLELVAGHMAVNLAGAERKVQQELSMVGVEDCDSLNNILDKFGLRKALRICGWVSRFIQCFRNPSEKISRLLTTDEILAQEKFWLKRAQQQALKSKKFTKDKEQLNLQLNADDIWQCRG